MLGQAAQGGCWEVGTRGRGSPETKSRVRARVQEREEGLWSSAWDGSNQPRDALVSMPRGADHAAGRRVPCRGKCWAECTQGAPASLFQAGMWRARVALSSQPHPPRPTQEPAIHPVGTRLQRDRLDTRGQPRSPQLRLERASRLPEHMGGIVLALGTREGSDAGQTSPACTGIPKSLIFRIVESDLLTCDSQAVLKTCH